MSIFVDFAPAESQPDSAATAAPSGRWRGRLTHAALPVLSLLVFFAVWQFVAVSGIWNQTFVPYPSTVWRAFLDVSTTHDGTRGYAGYLLVEHLYMTLRRVFAGVVIGVVLGVLLGLAMGSIGWVRSVPPGAVATTARLLLTGDGQALRPSSTLRRLRRAWAVRYRRESPAPG